jgi:hypothetical protein
MKARGVRSVGFYLPIAYRYWAIGYLALSLADCGGSDVKSVVPQDPDAATTDNSNAIAAFCAAASDVTCSVVASCCNVTIDACHRANEAQCLASLEASSRPGIKFNDAGAQECIASSDGVIDNCAYVPTATQQYQANLKACRDVLTGTVNVGAECAQTGDCIAQLGSPVNCMADANGIKRCTATPLSSQGGPCGNPAAGTCAEGLYCDPGATPSQCAPLKTSGAACRNPTECFSQICTSNLCVEPTIEAICQGLKST